MQFLTEWWRFITLPAHLRTLILSMLTDVHIIIIIIIIIIMCACACSRSHKLICIHINAAEVANLAVSDY